MLDLSSGFSSAYGMVFCTVSLYLLYLLTGNDSHAELQVICTQPRKTAARALALRVATEYAAGNERNGRSNGVVGYHVGGEPRFDQARCRIKYMTEAVFLTELLNQADLGR